MQIRQIPARELFTGVVSAIRDAKLHAESFHWTVRTDVPGLELGHSNMALDTFLEQGTVIAFHKAIEDNDFISISSIQINSGNGQHLLQFGLTGDGIRGTFTVHPSLGAPRQLVLIGGLRKHFQIFSAAAAYEAARQDADAAGIRERSIAIATLEEQARRLNAFLESSAQKDRDWQRSTRDDLEKENADRRAKLEKEFEDRRILFESNQQAAEKRLRTQVAEHDARVKAFETHESKYVRRDLLNRLQAELTAAQKPELSLSTQKKRDAVPRVVAAIEVIAGTLFFSILYLLVADNLAFDWHVALPLAASFTTMISTFVYYLRWLDRWYREHADLEFQASRFKADMLRASWVAELSAETHTIGNGAQIPSELVEALTRSLFRTDTAAPSEHPLEQLMSMIKRGTEVSVSKGNVQFKAAEPKDK